MCAALLCTVCVARRLSQLPETVRVYGFQRLMGRLVRPSGVEPPLLSEHGPEPCASANSATGAFRAARDISRAPRDVNQLAALAAISAWRIAIAEPAF